MRNRVESLDCFRGVMAVSVMLYHYSLWYIGEVSFSTTLGKLGIYAVSIFYILSGLSLSLVYQEKLSNFVELREYAIKRLFRIAPLFWLALTISVCYKFIYYNYAGGDGSINLYELFLNYTLTFGFFEPAAYFSTGAWSIGNEIVFYSIFPVAMIFSRKIFLSVIFPLSFLVYCYYAFNILQLDMSIDEQWTEYVNPFNQSFLFFLGVFLGLFKVELSRFFEGKYLSIMLFFLSGTVFVLVPVDNNSDIIYGWTRLVMTFVSFFIVLSVLFMPLPDNLLVRRSLLFLGATCYSIYLLHPLVNFPLVFLFNYFDFDVLYAYVISFILTLLISKFTYDKVERPLVKMSKMVTTYFMNKKLLA